jgi:hypothetical protein
VQNTKPITYHEMAGVIKRELYYRGKVYPGQVYRGMMSRDEAQRQIDVMYAILELVERCEREEERAGNKQMTLL